MRNRRIIGAHSFRSLGLDSDAVSWNSAQLRHMLPKRVRMRPNLRSGKDQCGIQIHQLVSCLRDPNPHPSTAGRKAETTTRCPDLQWRRVAHP